MQLLVGGIFGTERTDDRKEAFATPEYVKQGRDIGTI